MWSLAFVRLLLATALLVEAGLARSTFEEQLTIHPLSDGRISVAFDFTTHFDYNAGYHNDMTPPSLLLPLLRNNVSELSISFVAGKWDQSRTGESGPLQQEAGGGGAEVRAWLLDGSDVESRWTTTTQALGGLFCAGLGPSEEDSITTFGDIYPPLAHSHANLTHRMLSSPHLHLCTENLTPFLSLLPSKGQSGLSHLLAQPGIVFSWGFKTEGIEVIMPTAGQPGMWRGWWEGVVDLDPELQRDKSFSLGSLFHRGVPRPFPEATSSTLRVIQNDLELKSTVQPHSVDTEMLDNRDRTILKWDLLDDRLRHKDIKLSWEQDRVSQAPAAYDTPQIAVLTIPVTVRRPAIAIERTVTSPRAMDGVFTITIHNREDAERHAVYSEIWPWWVKGWVSEMQVRSGNRSNNDLLESIAYHPSTPPNPATSTIHLGLRLPPQNTLTITIPFTKLMLKYTEHRPDAERGREISSGVLTLLNSDTYRPRIYTSRLLLDVPTPDFSMPYNVIIMTSTVMAVFFGLMHGSLTRRWGWVELPGDKQKDSL